MAAKQFVSAKTCKSRVHALLTGPPGVGKTTLVRKVCSEVQKHGVVQCGFYTEEVREGGRGEGRGRRGPRIGFDVVTLDGKRGPLARVGSSQQPASHGRRKPPLVGKYQVDVESFEQIALPTLQLQRPEPEDDGPSSGSGNKKRMFAIDEIGKMELFSQDFVEVVQTVFQCPDVVILATIPVARQKSHWLVEELRQRPDCMLFEVSERNRDELVHELSDFLLKNLLTS